MGAALDGPVIALSGDPIITQQLSTRTEQRLDGLIEPIRTADASVANLEVLHLDYEGYSAARSGGRQIWVLTTLVEELTLAGFNCFNAATNHAPDYPTARWRSQCTNAKTTRFPTPDYKRTWPRPAAIIRRYLDRSSRRFGIFDNRVENSGRPTATRPTGTAGVTLSASAGNERHYHKSVLRAGPRNPRES